MLTNHIESLALFAKAIAEAHASDPAAPIEQVHVDRVRQHLKALELLLPIHNKQAMLRRGRHDHLKSD